MKNQLPADDADGQNGQVNPADGIAAHSKPSGGKKLTITPNNKDEKGKKKGIKAKCCK